MTASCLGLDTSNYTTSAAVFDGENGLNAGKLLEVPACQRHPECVHLVGVFVLVDTACAQQYITFFLVDSQYVLNMEGSVCDLPYESSVTIVEIEVGPAVAFRPPDQLLPILDQERGPGLDVGVGAFGDDDFGGIRIDSDPA